MKIKINGKEIELTKEVIDGIKEGKEDSVFEVKSDDLVIRTSDEDNAYKTNLIQENKKAGIEIAIKEYRNASGIEFEGKTVESLVEAVKKKAVEEAGKEPDQKLKEALSDNEKLKANIASLMNEKTEISNQFTNFKNESTVNSRILASIPDNTILPKEDVLTIVKAKMRFEMNETGSIVVSNHAGEVFKKKETLDPLSEKEVLNQFFVENPSYLKGASGGAGGDDSKNNGGGKMTVEAFIDKKAKEGVSHTDPKFMQELEQMQKDGLIEE